jgi:hypothetical protein
MSQGNAPLVFVTKELKYDFGSDSFNQQSFYATEAALNFVMTAYNFISLFRQVVLGQKSPPANENAPIQCLCHWRIHCEKWQSKDPQTVIGHETKGMVYWPLDGYQLHQFTLKF